MNEWEEKRQEELDKMFEFLLLERREKESLRSHIIFQEKEMIREAFQELQDNLIDWGYDYAAVKLHINEILKSKGIEEI